MEQKRFERRRGRRAAVQAPVLIRRMDAWASGAFREETTQDVSLLGVSFRTAEATAYAVNDLVIASVSIPESQAREFPFARLAGRARVARVQALAPSQTPDGQPIGVALEFSPNVTALTVVPPQV